jgi:hypothetical protein
MRTIEIDGVRMRLYHVGTGFPAQIYFNRAMREAIASPAQNGRSPKPEGIEQGITEFRMIEITDQEIWRKAMLRFRQ